MNEHVRLDNELGRIAATKEAFFAFVAAQPEGRYEYEDGEIVQQMAGGTARHSQVGVRFFLATAQQLNLNTWAVHGSDMGVDCGGQVRYPDMVVEAHPLDLSAVVTTRAVFALETLSPTTERLDLNRKPQDYGALPSMQAVLVAAQNAKRCHLWERATDGRWPERPHVVEGDGGVVVISALGLRFALDEVYAGLLEDED